MTTFSRGKVADLLAACKPIPFPEGPEDSKITVHAAVSKASVFYERIRNAIDYKDDHLLRKAAVKRILKRQTLLESDPRIIARNLLRELIAARYLENGQLPESTIDEAQVVVRKYTVLRKVGEGTERYRDWLLGVVSAELEELVSDRGQNKAIIHFLFEQLGDRIVLHPQTMEETERRLQVYIACHRVLFKADEEMLSYKLVRIYHSDWSRPETWADDPFAMSRELQDVERRIHDQLAHPFAQRFLMAVKPWAVGLRILLEAITEKPELKDTLGESSSELSSAVKKIAERHYIESKKRLRRGTWRSIIYLFITKMLLALAIELPFERLFYGVIHHLSLAVNILFPPVLMWVVGMFIRLPGKENSIRIVEAVDELLSPEGPSGRMIKVAPDRSVGGKLMFGASYLLMFLVTFGLVVLGLHSLKFTAVSSAIFLFFLSVVSFFAFRLRMGANEFVVLKEKESLRAVLVDFFTIPILRAGQYLSVTISKVNVFVFIFDFIIEVPFKTFLNVMEAWFGYLKEKKEELQ